MNWPVPVPGEGELLVRIGAAGINNTDINTRIGWYSKSVTNDTSSGAVDGFSNVANDDAGWSGSALKFPRIQGADICGEVVGLGENAPVELLGKRVLVRSMQPVDTTGEGVTCQTIGSEFDGGFAEFAVVRAEMAAPVESALTDTELASFPCAYSTAENMLERIDLKAGEHVLITGASGGVGSAAVQLAKRRGCAVTASSAPAKHSFVEKLGADHLVPRSITAEVEPNSIDVVVDLVGGDQFTVLLDVLKRGGRYVVAGAIGGPICELDLRTLYLKDLTLAGSTYQPMSIFDNLVRYIENGEIVPVVSKSYPLSDIATAQTDFISKTYPGKLVLVPDHLFADQARTGDPS